MGDSKCDDLYVNSYTLENLKDKSAVIFGTYLKLGNNCYLELEKFDISPLLLKPFETYVKEFGPLDLYYSNLQKSKINELLTNIGKNQTLVVATSDGKYEIRELISNWTPTSESRKYRETYFVQPKRFVFDGNSIGSRALYVVRIQDGDNKPYFEPVYKFDVGNYYFDSELLETDIISADALKDFLNKAAGTSAKSQYKFEVIDLLKFRKTQNRFIHEKHVLKIPKRSFFEHYVIDRIKSIIGKFRSNKKVIKIDHVEESAED